MHALAPSLSRGAPSARATMLDDHAVIAAQGPDATAFLHGQLTQDILGLAGQARPAGYCTAKGRLLATMVAWDAPADQTVWLLVRRDIADTLVKRLSMFVLRAKVKLALAPLRVAGVWCGGGADAFAALSAAAGGDLPGQPWQRADLPCGTWIAVPSAGETKRWWWMAPAAQQDPAGALAGLFGQADAAAWAADDIAAGLPWVQAATQDMFIPQTVNLDLIGGVSFTKGCYPGQEVVARSHYRGTLKRRMAYGTAPAAAGPVQPGSDVYEAGRPEPCGRVVNAAPAPQGVALLFEAAFEALARGALRLGSADGPAITPAALPYEVPAPA